MKRAVLGAGLVLFAANSTAGTAEIYRCTASGGAVTYQEVPCPSATQSRLVNVPSVYPEYDRAERDRLFRREAALDARLLKRAEIDAAERIARDERVAREREAEAERARARNTPSYIVGWPVRMHRHATHPHQIIISR